ncbi:pyridoxamine 5'-phosphate oxidase [Neisseria bacilliformis ATCC BAA-1200]|uniref:Pyridoxamine 5'-phosphate oxidase n=1 Tax=Neisseria bacilliformis ATCC BAA-1200 TaxID=888742 RepID=F2BEJ1_9NEIS|nr:pyridoxamine 5'-phosphate oxidase [Neisseria bacilliformis ATCC BAA-1200]
MSPRDGARGLVRITQPPPHTPPPKPRAWLHCTSYPNIKGRLKKRNPLFQTAFYVPAWERQVGRAFMPDRLTPSPVRR